MVFVLSLRVRSGRLRQTHVDAQSDHRERCQELNQEAHRLHLCAYIRVAWGKIWLI